MFTLLSLFFREKCAQKKWMLRTKKENRLLAHRHCCILVYVTATHCKERISLHLSMYIGIERIAKKILPTQSAWRGTNEFCVCCWWFDRFIEQMGDTFAIWAWAGHITHREKKIKTIHQRWEHMPRIDQYAVIRTLCHRISTNRLRNTCKMQLAAVCGNFFSIHMRKTWVFFENNDKVNLFERSVHASHVGFSIKCRHVRRERCQMRLAAVSSVHRNKIKVTGKLTLTEEATLFRRTN